MQRDKSKKQITQINKEVTMRQVHVESNHDHATVLLKVYQVIFLKCTWYEMTSCNVKCLPALQIPVRINLLGAFCSSLFKSKWFSHNGSHPSQYIMIVDVSFCPLVLQKSLNAALIHCISPVSVWELEATQGPLTGAGLFLLQVERVPSCPLPPSPNESIFPHEGVKAKVCCL